MKTRKRKVVRTGGGKTKRRKVKAALPTSAPIKKEEEDSDPQITNYQETANNMIQFMKDNPDF